MGQSTDDLKKLLKTAEDKIVCLQAENQSLAQSFGEMLDAQKHEAAQMAALSEQIWALEDALKSSSQEKNEALNKLTALKKTICAVQKQMTETLEAAARNASRVEIAARVYEMATSSEAAALDKMIREYNASLQAAKLK